MIAFPHRRAAPIRYERLPGAVIAAWPRGAEKDRRRPDGRGEGEGEGRAPRESETEHYRVGYFLFLFFFFRDPFYDRHLRREKREKKWMKRRSYGLTAERDDIKCVRQSYRLRSLSNRNSPPQVF